jgi:Icc-related predicted phosphoesterase
MLQVSKPTDKNEVEIDTIVVNIRRIGCINFNLNSPLIMMKLSKMMENVIYISKEGNVEQLKNSTKLVSGKIRNFAAYDFDSNCMVDCIVYNSER